MTSDGLGEMFEGDSADTCAGKFSLNFSSFLSLYVKFKGDLIRFSSLKTMFNGILVPFT